jgi:hypothetical protein
LPQKKRQVAWAHEKNPNDFSVERETLNLLARTKVMFVFPYHPYQQPCQSSNADALLGHRATLDQSDPLFIKLSKGMYCQPQQCLWQPVSFKNVNTRGDH